MLSEQLQVICDVESHCMCHPEPFHFTLNSMWFNVKFHVKITLQKSALMMFVSDPYAFRTSSGASWSGNPSNVSFDTINFHFTWNSMWFHVKFNVKIFFWFEAKEWSHDSCFVSLCLQEKFKCSVMWRSTVCAEIISRGISHGITWNSMWFEQFEKMKSHRYGCDSQWRYFSIESGSRTPKYNHILASTSIFGKSNFSFLQKPTSGDELDL